MVSYINGQYGAYGQMLTLAVCDSPAKEKEMYLLFHRNCRAGFNVYTSKRATRAFYETGEVDTLAAIIQKMVEVK